MDMRIQERKQRIERRRQLAGAWKPNGAGAAENELFDRCFSLAEDAIELERTAGSRGAAGATGASLACFSSAFESLANSMLQLRSAALRELEPEATSTDEYKRGGIDQLERSLFVIDQNLRFAAHAADLGREAVEASADRGASPSSHEEPALLAGSA